MNRVGAAEGFAEGATGGREVVGDTRAVVVTAAGGGA